MSNLFVSYCVLFNFHSLREKIGPEEVHVAFSFFQFADAVYFYIFCHFMSGKGVNEY